MTHHERVSFIASRQNGIGGSDVGSLLSNLIPVEYGCERNLWARLSGIPADSPELESELMMIGTIAEPFIRRTYSETTGRSVTADGDLKKHPVHESLQYHKDGIIHPAPGDHRDSDGVLEIKAIGQMMMYKVQAEGIIIDYTLQVQAGMASHELSWGAFAVATREDILPLIAIEQAAILAGDPMPKLPRRPKILHFEVERNEDIIGLIEEKGPAFWKTIGVESQAPPRMNPEDPRCGRCVRQVWCQGAAVMASVQANAEVIERPDLAPLVEEYRANHALLDEAEALVKFTEDKWRVVIGTAPKIKVQVDGKWKNVIYNVRKGRESVDGREMANQYDALRRAAIAAELPGVELVPPSSAFVNVGMPSRPLMLKGLLPKKVKAVGEFDTRSEEEE